MIFFRNDYGEGCVDSIMQLLIKSNEESHPGYGCDEYSKRAAEIIQSKLPDTPSDIHFIVSGTLANLTMIRHCLRPYEVVLAADTAHIVVHEAGAIEAIGHKVFTIPNSNGKITPSSLERAYLRIIEDTTIFQVPRLVYISNSTELGTVYTRNELEKLSEICKKFDMYLMMDGARLGPALMSGVDYSLNDIARWCDIFDIGGTKNGGLFGEAIVITNPDLKPYFRYVQKQSGAIMAKGWLIALQFIGLFENDDFYKCAKHANELAKQIQDSAIELGYPMYMRSTTNQIFIVLNQIQYKYLKERIDFEIWGTWGNDTVIRLCTSWHTSQEEVDYLKVYMKEAMDQYVLSVQTEEEKEVSSEEKE
ncbi:threonine aldolase family protein [Ileibacterium valens]|uniref:Aromatic amino acid beta-eliminating lyase/threonine aldolase domain-containing protein n=1 Tax=Ileibacterium valens TaxID=1862668 RepID=A0A1U7NDP9_9FIRM|nr:aminotransferase class I/II-fold pyridoxal phosphate-dependent enzyme [Ileibacterium valens]OLU37468.1 hypothetical protein BO222_10665 [Ileibacterium valens]OLU39258.1 hypothetical protein BO224_07670 [Erysipelotrichaceae bacterium NYU-BL-E8]